MFSETTEPLGVWIDRFKAAASETERKDIAVWVLANFPLAQYQPPVTKPFASRNFEATTYPGTRNRERVLSSHGQKVHGHNSFSRLKRDSCILATEGYELILQYADSETYLGVWQENYQALQSFRLRQKYCCRCRVGFVCDAHAQGPLCLYMMPAEYWTLFPDFGDWVKDAFHILRFRFRTQQDTIVILSRLFPEIVPTPPPRGHGPFSTYTYCWLLYDFIHTSLENGEDPTRDWTRPALTYLKRKYGPVRTSAAYNLDYFRRYFSSTEIMF